MQFLLIDGVAELVFPRGSSPIRFDYTCLWPFHLQVLLLNDAFFQGISDEIFFLKHFERLLAFCGRNDRLHLSVYLLVVHLGHKRPFQGKDVDGACELVHIIYFLVQELYILFKLLLHQRHLFLLRHLSCFFHELLFEDAGLFHDLLILIRFSHLEFVPLLVVTFYVEAREGVEVDDAPRGLHPEDVVNLLGLLFHDRHQVVACLWLDFIHSLIELQFVDHPDLSFFRTDSDGILAWTMI